MGIGNWELGILKTVSNISPERVEAWNRAKYNPIRGLTPLSLSRTLDEMDRGELRRAALLFDKIERRDDVLMSVAAKRRKDAARRDWSVAALEDSPRARRHAEAVEYFLANLRVTSAVEGDFLQGWPGLVRTMMDAVGKRYAVHEIIWRPGRGGVSAELKFVPLWFFENRTGKLRYLAEPHARTGVDLEPGEWMVTHGEGLMEGCSVGHLYKTMSLKDWVVFNEKFGLPGIWAKTQAQPGSGEYDALHDAVRDWMNDGAIVTGGDVEVTTLAAKAGSLVPMADLIERIDKRMMAVWRGGDLSTQSQGDSVGASVQDDEAALIAADDLEMIATTVNLQLVPHIVRAATGDEVPLAAVSLPAADAQDVQADLAVDEFFRSAGVAVSLAGLRERYGRPEPVDEADASLAPVRGADSGGDDGGEELGNEASGDSLVEAAVARSLDVMPAVLAPIGHVLDALVAAAEAGTLDDEDFLTAATEAALAVPELMDSLDVGALARVMEGAMGTAALQGLDITRRRGDAEDGKLDS